MDHTTVNLNLEPQPLLIKGGRHDDARGALRFCNDFDMSSVKRFYTIANSAANPKRGWIMHKRETKWFFPLTGVTKIEVEPVGRGASPFAPAAQSFALLASNPAVLCVPPNHWFCIEQDGASEVMVFSNCHVGEFPNDDFRRPL